MLTETLRLEQSSGRTTSVGGHMLPQKTLGFPLASCLSHLRQNARDGCAPQQPLQSVCQKAGETDAPLHPQFRHGFASASNTKTELELLPPKDPPKQHGTPAKNINPTASGWLPWRQPQRKLSLPGEAAPMTGRW